MQGLQKVLIGGQIGYVLQDSSCKNIIHVFEELKINEAPLIYGTIGLFFDGE